jgi:hypothetical protein
MTGERGVKVAFNLSWEELNSEPEAQILALYISLFALAPFPKGMIMDLFPVIYRMIEWVTFKASF